MESMKGRLDGTALRVPIPDGSITDFTGILGKDVTAEEVNEAYRAAAASGALSTVLVYNEDRSEERRVGPECVSPCRSRWSPYPETKKTQSTRYEQTYIRSESKA